MAATSEGGCAVGCRAVEVWLPEAGGRFDADDPRHQALMTMLGAQSGERARRMAYDRTGGESGSSAAGLSSAGMSWCEVSCIVATTIRPTSAAKTA